MHAGGRHFGWCFKCVDILIAWPSALVHRGGYYDLCTGALSRLSGCRCRTVWPAAPWPTALSVSQHELSAAQFSPPLPASSALSQFYVHETRGCAPCPGTFCLCWLMHGVHSSSLREEGVPEAYP